MDLKISTPQNFSFRRTVASHGWYGLLPFSLDSKKWELTRVIDVGVKPPVTVVMTGLKNHVRLTISRPLTKAESTIVLRDVRHILRLDDNLEIFYQIIDHDPDFAWISEQGAGRLLRSPTVFEDLVKMICTTNCSWALTEKMVTGLVQNLGRETNDGRRSFPTPQSMASMPAKFFVDEVRAGYRAPYLKELSDRVASGELNVEEWLHSDYAAENLLKLLGRYDGLALDSWTRAKFYQVRNNGRKANDKKIARYYARFNEWRGLVLWCDVTRDWL
jgi:3-methyladenine DNA glycosylase/8-oxoguanine DNA glycosylase